MKDFIYKKMTLLSVSITIIGLGLGVLGTLALWKPIFSLGEINAGDIQIIESGWSETPQGVLNPGDKFLTDYSFETSFIGDNFRGKIDIVPNGSYEDFFPNDTANSKIYWRLSHTPNLTEQDVLNTNSTEFLTDLKEYNNEPFTVDNIITTSGEEFYLYLLVDYKENSPIAALSTANIDFNIIFRQTREGL